MGPAFTLVPSPLGLGMGGGGGVAGEWKGNEPTSTLPAVAPLRLTKSPRLTPSSGLRLASLGSPLSPVPAASPVIPLAEDTKSSSRSLKLPDSLYPGMPGSLSPSLPVSPLASLEFLTPRQRSPALSSSLSPGSRSPVFPPGSPSALAQYTFPAASGSGSRPAIPNPYTPLPTPYGSTFPSIPLNQNQNATPNPPTSLPSQHLNPSLHFTSTASSGSSQPNTIPLSLPPRSPLPPLPAGSLPSPALPSVGLPSTSDESRSGNGSTTGDGSNGVVALSASLPSPAFPMSALPVGRGAELKVVATGEEGEEEKNLRGLYPFEGLGGHGDGYPRGWGPVDEGSGADDEGGGEGNTTRLSTLDAFRRRIEELSEDEDQYRYEVDSEEDEGEQVLRMRGGWIDVLGIKHGAENGSGDDDDGAHSDGEVGIGLSLMGAFGDDDDGDGDDCNGDDEDEGERGQPMGGNTGANSAGVGTTEKTPFSGSGGTTPIPWTRYTPTSPVGPASQAWNEHGQDQDQPTKSSLVQGRSQAQNRHRETGDAEEGEGEEDEDEDGGYWDDIYDDYRYSRYSLASKRFSALSKASGVSKASSKARANVPPMPLPNLSFDRPSLDAPRPSFGSDARSAHSRPSTESTSTAASNTTSDSMQLACPQFERSVSEESRLSAYSTQTLSPLSTQFPAVPVYVPVRTESRLKIGGFMEFGDDVLGKKGLQIVHESAEGGDEGAGEANMNIEVAVESMHGGDSIQGQDFDAKGQRPSLNTALSPLLHTTFGSPRSSRHTDTEDGSDHNHGRRYSGKSHGSYRFMVEPLKSPIEGPLKSPIEGGRMASALRARMEGERGTISELAVPASTPVSGAESGIRAIVVDDEEGHPPSIDTGADYLFPATSQNVISPPRTSSAAQAAPLSASLTPGAPLEQLTPEQSSFLRPRPANKVAHPFARTSIFLPHPNAPKVSYQSQGPLYGRTATPPYSNPVPPDLGPASLMYPPSHNATFFSVQILHLLRNASNVVSQGPARRPPKKTLFARCQPDLNVSMAPVPILFSLDPLPPLPPQAQMQGGMMQGGQAGVPPMMNMPPTRAATVSVPARSSSAVPAALVPVLRALHCNCRGIQRRCLLLRRNLIHTHRQLYLSRVRDLNLK
ncbi:hypothetical protein PAXRUDRAFT_309974 [Paxillus rubicundulus Ve08.2h10]|uniref:Uncharacterized protein n=1 Tax=Paxillus rubicundulus Ve08.2h10 TaxID=930991 RepID=A0A0D0DDG7_9AGAM|nr:hypothetical protein PAXRUDRAFT_309974 [Paxillus rubicundulus Ve08.2h10]